MIDAGTFDTQHNVGTIERWVTGIAGAALLLGGISRNSAPVRVLAGGLGAGLLWRAATGHCPIYQRFGVSSLQGSESAVMFEGGVTIMKPVAEVYAFYRDLQNLPLFMKHLESVEVIDETRSRWRLAGPGGAHLAWDAEIIEERAGELIAWQSLPHSQISSFGEVRFQEAPGGRGTELTVTFGYVTTHAIAAIGAKLLAPLTELTLAEEVRNLKQILETGEIATTVGQPNGRMELPRAVESSPEIPMGYVTQPIEQLHEERGAL